MAASGHENTRFDNTKAFIESLQVYNTPGKLKNFRHEASEVAAHRDALDALAESEALAGLVADLGPAASYLEQAALVLGVREGREDREKLEDQSGGGATNSWIS